MTDNNKIQANSVDNNKIQADLTSQWKKGELPEGFYFVNDGAEVTIDYYLCDYWERHLGCDVQQVIAPVPSYKEYEQLENWNRFTADYHALREAKEIAEYEKVELLEKVKQLKELLKDCRLAIYDYPPYDLASDKIRLMNKIDEVLKCGNIK